MRNKRKGSRNSFTAYPVLIGLLVLTLNSVGKNSHAPFFDDTLTSRRDSIPPKTDSIPPKRDSLPPAPVNDTTTQLPDSALVIVDSTTRVPQVDTINLRISKDSMDAPVDYKAEDSMVLDVKS